MSTPVFIDVAYAADMLRATPDAVLDLVKQGKLRPYGGREPNLFFRSADVAALVSELGPSSETEPPKRVKTATARVQTRLTSDTKWAEIAEDDIRDWASHSDRPRREAARKAVSVAKQRLEDVLRVLDEKE